MTKTAPTKAAPLKRGYRHLTTSEKAEMVKLWTMGEATLEDLAKKFKKDTSSIARVLKEEGAEKGSGKEALAKRVSEAVEASIVSDATVYAERIKETKEEHYKMASGVAKLAWSIAVKAQRENRAQSTTSGDQKALSLLAHTLKITREERYAVLGLKADDAGEDRPLPDLVVQELSAEDIKEMHRASMVQAEEGDDGLFDMELGDESLIDEDDERVEIDE
jgi:hypothetical protein